MERRRGGSLHRLRRKLEGRHYLNLFILFSSMWLAPVVASAAQGRAILVGEYVDGDCSRLSFLFVSLFLSVDVQAEKFCYGVNNYYLVLSILSVSSVFFHSQTVKVSRWSI